MFSKFLPQKNARKLDRKDEDVEWEHAYNDDFQASPRLPNLSKSKIRVLMYRDCEKRGKSLLFDTDAVMKIDEKKTIKSNLCSSIGSGSSSGRSTPCEPKLVNGENGVPQYKCTRPNSDTKLLGEMIFGSVAMVYRGGSIQKVHLIRSPPRLLMTKVFPLKMESDQAEFCDSLSTSSLTQSGSFLSPRRNVSFDTLSLCSQTGSPADGFHSLPRAMPLNMHNYSNGINRSFSDSMTSIDSLNMSTSSSVFSLPQSPVGSLQRRWYRSQATSLDFGQILKGPKGSSDELLAFRRQPKLAIAVMFKMWEGNEEKNKAFQKFFFAHYSLFECHLEKLRATMEKSIYQRKSFFHSALQAAQEFSEKIHRFCFSPRIVHPVWLQLTQNNDKSTEISHSFMASLVKLTDRFEQKETKCFISTLLTAVLTHHLSWVATVMPVQSLPYRAYLNKHSSKQLDVLAKCHPYNPLWEQLSDLYGSLGTPLRITKTVVVGKHASLVKQILFLLSYFIRCSDVTEHSARISEDFLSAVDGSSMEYLHNAKDDLRHDSNRKEEGTPCRDPHCLCEVMSNINYVGENNIRNLRKMTLPDKDKPLTCPLEASFECYCCSAEREVSTRYTRSLSIKSLLRKESNDGSLNVCTICGDGEQCSCECLARKRIVSVQDIDSDYCSIANDELAGTMAMSVKSTGSDSDSATDSYSDDLSSLHLLEVPMPGSQPNSSYHRPRKSNYDFSTFGKSLMAGYCDEYSSDFVLQGVEQLDTEQIMNDMQHSIKHCALDEPVSEASYIVANTDTWTCEVWKLLRIKDPFTQLSSDELIKGEVFTSSFVSSMLDAVKGLSEINISPEFCIMHIEDQLRNIYDRSAVVVQYVRSKEKMMTRKELEEKFGYRGSDLDLILAVAGTHVPYIYNLIDTES